MCPSVRPSVRMSVRFAPIRKIVKNREFVWITVILRFKASGSGSGIVASVVRVSGLVSTKA